MTLLEELIDTLKTDERLVSDGQLLKNKIIELGLKLDEKLISLLLENDNLKEHFFKTVNKVIIFDKDKFMKFVDNKEFLPDSYTTFKNKIGLTTQNEYLAKSGEVVLSWPYKDCVLEGGMEDPEEKNRKEVFWNEILAPDEIDRLFDPKVLTGFKRIDAKGEHKVDEIEPTDNLIIKGNNLLVLHSLKKRYAGKVKLIYIDPPYNPDSNANTFNYNNTFNESSWLTFIKNRLDVAKKLLKKDGVLIVAIDENEHFLLGSLLKEMFPDSDVHCITIVHNPRGVQGTNFSYIHEYAIFIIPKGQKSICNREIKPDEIEWSNFRNWGGESLREDAKNCFYPVIIENNQIIGFGDVLDSESHPKEQSEEKNGQFYVWPIDTSGVERKWRYARQSVEEIKHLLRAKRTVSGYEIEIGKDFGTYKTVWIDTKYDANEYGTKIVSSLVPNNKFSFPKSLWNVYDCLHSVISNDKEAIVLDFFAGSGTTAHALLELNKKDEGNRKFILCEQMDYVDTITKERVKKVIEHEKHGSFVYLELMKWNETYMDKIQAAKSSKELLTIWDKMKTEAFLSYKVNPKQFDENVQDFKDLDMEKQKTFLIECLDKNQLYVNFSEIDDEDYGVSEEDKQINKRFYGVL